MKTIRVRVRALGIPAMMGIELVVSQMTLPVTLVFPATYSDVSTSESIMKTCDVLDQEVERFVGSLLTTPET